VSVVILHVDKYKKKSN